LPATSSSPPGEQPGRVAQSLPIGRTLSCSALLPMGFTKPSRSPGLLVSSYLTVSPLPAGEPAGGLFSVALSLASRLVGVTHHRTLRSPDFPPAETMSTLAQDLQRKAARENLFPMAAVRPVRRGSGFGRRSPGPLRFFKNSRTDGGSWQGPIRVLYCESRLELPETPLKK